MTCVDDLTRQERRVLALVAAGQRNATIARHLYISTRTVENHLYRIYDKLRVSSRTEAAIMALQRGLLSDGELSRNSHDSEASRH